MVYKTNTFFICKTNQNRQLKWQSNAKYIETHNKKADLGLETYRLALNEYSDMDAEEFSLAFKGFTGFNTGLKSVPLKNEEMIVYNVPDSVNWTAVSGYVQPIQNQGNCG